ncbi:DsbA family protein [Thermoflexus sp.]|uniref:DsbA family protein n=1 Tax=Thermoflexus sp. TaxID=1969742 RepID=UPI0035E3F491
MTKRAPHATRASSPQPLPLLIIVAAVLVVAALIGYQLWANRPSRKVTAIDYPTGLTPDGYPYKGNPEAKVVIEEYSDFQCPVCARYTHEVAPRLDEKYVKTGKVYYIFRYFPFLGPESFRAAEAAACAAEQGKFWEYEQTIFANQRGENLGWFSDERLIGFAVRVGLDREAFGNCLRSGKYRDFIRGAAEAGRQRGVRATPTLFINGEKIEGLYDLAFYETYIDTLLQKSQ